jgi:hypothetical protein
MRKKLIECSRAVKQSLSLILLASLLGSCAEDKPIILPSGRQVFRIVSSLEQDKAKIHLTKIDPKSGKTVPFTKEDYPGVNGSLVISENTFRELVDPICADHPDLCKKIFDTIRNANP